MMLTSLDEFFRCGETFATAVLEIYY